VLPYDAPVCCADNTKNEAVVSSVVYVYGDFWLALYTDMLF
jgi:hypothetical protein